MITRSQFIANYKAAEARALTTCVGAGFAKSDRLLLNAQRKELRLSYGEAAVLVGGGSQGKVVSRFKLWDAQISRGDIRVAPLPTGVFVGVSSGVGEGITPFDGRIKTTADIQPAFNKAAVQLVKLGITNSHDAAAYLANGFQHALTEQKIDIKADRLLGELRMGDLTKPQALAVLDRIKAAL